MGTLVVSLGACAACSVPLGGEKSEPHPPAHSEWVVIQDLKAKLLKSMLDYMPHGSYTRADVQRCGLILDRYLEEIAVATNEAAAFLAVETAVLSLNELNAAVDESLIETNEREQLWAILTRAGNARGFFDGVEDVTGAWRDW